MNKNWNLFAEKENNTASIVEKTDKIIEEALTIGISTIPNANPSKSPPKSN